MVPENASAMKDIVCTSRGERFAFFWFGVWSFASSSCCFAWLLSCPRSPLHRTTTTNAIVQHHPIPSLKELASKSPGDITDWVIENLESNDSIISSASKSMAGENDTLPVDGLCIGKVRILPSDTDYVCKNETTTEYYMPIKLLVGRNGWGTGVHPTTRLCIEWLCDTIRGGETILVRPSRRNLQWFIMMHHIKKQWRDCTGNN